MLSLHTVTEDTRHIAKWIALGFGALILLVILFRVGRNIKEYFYPTPPTPPTVSFGKLPDIALQVSTTENNFTYTLDTISGTLPTFPDRLTVYQTQKREANLLNLRDAQAKAEKMGFKTDGVRVSDTTYQWTDATRTLVFDIVHNNFHLTSNFFTNPENLSNNQLPDEPNAKDQAGRFLSDIGVFPVDIDPDKTTVTYLTVSGQQMQAATSRSTATIAKVDFFQKDVEQLPIYYPNPPFSLIEVLITGGSFQSKVIEVTFFYSSLTQSSATYPIVTAEQAFEKLKNGEGYVASYYGTAKTIQITKVSLGYFLGNTNPDYMLPIVVFEGNDGFFAYVPAITPEWVGK